MSNVVELVEMVTGKLSTFASSDVVVGAPIELGKTTIVPLSRLSIGFGAGGGGGEGKAGAARTAKKRGGRGKGSVTGGGGGARVRPVGVAVITDAGVDIIPIPGPKGVIDRIFDLLPDLVDKVKGVVAKVEGDSKE